MCVYESIYTHICKYNVWMKWSLFYILNQENQPQKFLQNKKTMFPAARKQLPPAVPTAEVKSLLYFLLYLM